MRKISSLSLLYFVLCFLLSPRLDAVYIPRFTAVGERGAMTFTGNTLGLSKQNNANEPGTRDAIGAYITTDTSLQVGTFPMGTTLDYSLNNAAAELVLPAGSTVLYAELIWSGSYGYISRTQGAPPDDVLIPANGPINFITPDSVVHQVVSDPATRQNVQNPSPGVSYPAGNYTRSQNVTSLVQTAKSGTYTVGGIPSTISAEDNNHNAAGWTLAVIYREPTFPINNMTLFVGCEQASEPGAPAEVNGFCTPPSGPVSGRILVSAIEGDATGGGDHMAFGPTPMTMVNLSGPNNKVDNFFASQINGDDGNLDTAGTFGNRNQDAANNSNISAGRQGYDITNVDAGMTLVNGQSQAFAQGITNVGGEDFTINALGIQIEVTAPVIDPIKKVNGMDGIDAEIGEIVTFSSVFTNTGNNIAFNVLFIDPLEMGLSLLPNTFTVNMNPIANPDLVNGVPLGDFMVNDSATIEFQVEVVGFPEMGNVFTNISTAKFDFIPCREEIENEVESNPVTLTLPERTPPRQFEGRVKPCHFLDRTRYTLVASWLPPFTFGVVSYQILQGEEVVAQIPATDPLRFETCLRSKKEASSFSVVAVYPGNQKSAPVQIVVVK